MSYKISDTSEVWRDIVGYEGIYEVSSTGQVRNSKGVILKQSQRPETGYLYVLLRGKRKAFHANIQRLVAMAFLQNPNNYPVVNHINEDRTDNRVENLEWCSYSQNSIKSSKIQALQKSILQCDKKGNIIAFYKSIHEAARKLGSKTFATNICACLRGREKSYKGYIWRYYDGNRRLPEGEC